MKSLFRVVLFCALAISAFAVFFEVGLAQTFRVSDAARMSEQVYIEISAADSAGANVSVLANQYNVALSLIDNAQRLDNSGNHTGAALLGGQAESILESIPGQAGQLKNDAMVKRQIESRNRTVAIPVEALMIALGSTAFIVIRRRVKFKQATELRVVAK